MQPLFPVLFTKKENSLQLQSSDFEDAIYESGLSLLVLLGPRLALITFWLKHPIQHIQCLSSVTKIPNYMPHKN